MALGSIMSIQAQTAVQTKPVVQVEKSTGENNPSVTVQEAQKIDKSLNVVQDSQQKGGMLEQGMKEQQQQQPSNEQVKKAVEQLNKNMFNHILLIKLKVIEQLPS